MSKSIKVSEDVYKDLQGFQKARESYSDTIRRLLRLADVLDKAEPLIHGTYEYLKAQQEKREREKEG